MAENIMQLAQAMEREHRWEEAAEQYESMLKESPTVAIYERAAWCFSRAGSYQKAIDYSTILHELEPHSAKWAYITGYQYYSQSDWNAAINWFEKALEIYPKYFTVKYRLAYAYTKTSGTYMRLTKAEYWRAIGHLKECHKLWTQFNEAEKQKERDTYFNVNFLHGKILMDLPRHYSEAIELFKAALLIKPDDEFANYNLAKTYYLNGDYIRAKSSLPSGNKYYIIELSAYIEAKMGNYTEAICIIKNLLVRRKKDYLYSFLAEVYLLNNELDKAYRSVTRALSISNSNHRNYYIAAKVYFEYGLLDKAIENLDYAIQMKKKKYNSNYNECEELRQKIVQTRSLDYSDDPQLIEKLNESIAPKSKHGIVSYYNTDKGFGFIKQSNEDVFFHISDCKYSEIIVGDKVCFSTTTTNRGSKAIDIMKL